MIGPGLIPKQRPRESYGRYILRCTHWRRALLERANGDIGFQRALWDMSRENILFYVNFACWGHNPRDFPDQPCRPFITCEKQDEIFLAIKKAIHEGADINIPKSRQIGGSWLNIIAIEHGWHFYAGHSYLMVSRKEDLVDKPGATSSLFGKIDYIHQHQPTWLLPTGRHLGRKDDPRRTDMHLENADNGSVIDGEATVTDIGRGDTRTAILLDEYGLMPKAELVEKATRPATSCRIRCSTPRGRVGLGRVFYQQCQNKAAVTIPFHWSDYPPKARGLYRVVIDKDHSYKHSIEIIDNAWHEEYEKRTGKPYEFRGPDDRGGYYKGLRSPWYDRQCDRAESENEIRQEEDLDFLAEGQSYFDDKVLERHKALFCRIDALHRGTLETTEDEHEPEWIEDSMGDWKLWVPLEPQTNHPPFDSYFIGCDLGSGLGGTHTSNSTIEIINSCGEQVAEFASDSIKPDVVAHLAIAAAKWFWNAKLNWEANGQNGSAFTSVIAESDYNNVYVREQMGLITKKTTSKIGWQSDDNTRPKLFSDLRSAVQTEDSKLLIRSEALLAEFGEYIVKGGKAVHAGAVNSENEADKDKLHGDRVIGIGCAWWVARDYVLRLNKGTVKKKDPPVKPGSIAARRASKKKETKRRSWARR